MDKKYFCCKQDEAGRFDDEKIQKITVMVQEQHFRSMEGSAR